MTNGNPDSRGAESNAMARWQGGVDADLREHLRRLDRINGDAAHARETAEMLVIELAKVQSALMTEIASLRSETRVELATLRVKVALGATIGGLLGAGVISGAIALLTG